MGKPNPCEPLTNANAHSLFGPMTLEKLVVRCYCNFLTTIRSHNRGRRPQARGPRRTIEKDKCAIFSENCATLNVINSRGYTQICVGLGDSLQAGLEARVHAIDKSFD